jgi:hypothetical protein
MLFREHQHLNETHTSGQTAEMQEYPFQEEGSYAPIENINGSTENDGIFMPIQVITEFPLAVFVLIAVSSHLW